MRIKKAVSILKYHNEWRRGKECPIIKPALLGRVIDKVVDYVECDVKIDRTEKRTDRIDIRVSPTEKKKIFALCKKEKLSVADWIIKQVERELK